MTPECNIGVVVVTHDEPRFTSAIRSLLATRQLVRRVYIVNNGTTDRDANRALYQGTQELHDAGVEFRLHDLPQNLGAGPARDLAYQRVLGDVDINLVACLDADDEYGTGFLPALHKTFSAANGQVDLIVPSHIREIRESDGTCTTRSLRVPEVPENLLEPSEELLEAWVKLTSVGATFGVNVEAIRAFGGFVRDSYMDEWVVMLCRCAGLGARFRHADIRPRHSYRYLKKEDHHSQTRAAHEATRRDAARRGFWQAQRVRRTLNAHESQFRFAQ